MIERRTVSVVGTALLVLVIGSTLIVLDAQRHQSDQRASVEDQLVTHAARLQSAVAERVRETRTLSAAAGGATTDEIDDLVRGLAESDNAIVGGGVLEDGVVVAGAMPRIPDSLMAAIGLETGFVGTRLYDPDSVEGDIGTVIDQMIVGGETGIFGPMQLPLVSFEILIAGQTVPDTDGRQFSMVLIDMDEVLADADISRETSLAGRTLRVALTVDSLFEDDQVSHAVAFGDAGDDAVVAPVLAPDVEWQLAAVPITGWDRWSPASLPLALLTALGAVVAGVLAGHRHDMRAELTAALTEAEDDARRARRREQMLARHAPTGLLEIGADGRVASANASAARLLATTVDALLGAPAPDPLIDALGDAGINSAETDIRFEWRPDATTVLSVHASPPGDSTDAEGPRAGIVLSLHDITREHTVAELQQRHTLVLEQAHADLEHVQQIRGDLIDKVSHEIRTPVTVIQGVAELLAEPELDAGRQRELVQALQRQTVRLGSCLDHLLRIAESQSSSGAPLTWDPGEPTHTVGVVFVQVAERLGLACSVDAPEVRARLADDHLRVIADVLLANARTHGVPPITVTVRDASQSVEIDVSDAGLPPADREHIFDVFVQASMGDHRRTGGLGLGLASARRMARLAGGDLALLPDTSSTTFRLTLPVSLDGGRVEDTAAPAELAGQGRGQV